MNHKIQEINLAKSVWDILPGFDDDNLGKTIIKESLDSIHNEGYRLRSQDYVDLLKKQPKLYNDFPDDVKCQELELAAKIS